MSAGGRHPPVPEPAGGDTGALHGSRPPDTDALADRAAAAIWILLAVIAGVRASFAFLPGMAAWGLNTMRFLPPGVAWSTWVLTALPLIPVIGRLAASGFTAAPSALRSPWAAALAAMLLVLLIPDRIWYVGDFLLREGSVVEGLRNETVFRQALPLDRALHHDLPRWLFARVGLDAHTAARLIGMLGAGAFAVLAAILPRVLGLGGPAALAAAAIAFFGGYLVLFTGYGKAVVELGVLAAAVGITGLRVLRSGTGVLAFGIALALALPLHRSAVGLMPAALVVWALWLRDPRSRAALGKPATVVGVALPWMVLAFVVPRVVHTFFEVDLPIHLVPATVRADGVWVSAFSGLRPLDFVNILAMLSPLAVLIPLGFAIARGDAVRRRDAILLLALVLPGLAWMPFLHPAQGLFRDWDNFIVTGISLSLFAGWAVGEILRDATIWAWLGVAAALGAAMPSVEWMLLHADSERSVDRIRAFIAEPPARTEAERALALDFLGIRYLRAQEDAKAAEMFRQAVELAPSPRLHIQWALAETRAGNLRGALGIYQRMIARVPDDQMAWRGYTAMASRLEMWPEAKRGAERLLQLVPGDAQALELLEAIARQGPAPDSLR